MSESEFRILIALPVFIAVFTSAMVALDKLWIMPTATGNIDGQFGNRLHAHKFSGLRLRAYNRAHRKNSPNGRLTNV